MVLPGETQQNAAQQNAAQQNVAAHQDEPGAAGSRAGDDDDGQASDPATTSVGGRIRAARESRGWDIDEVVRQTSLSPRIIRGIEADDFSASHGDCYARGHLRILARALSLDEASVLVAVPPSDPLADPADTTAEPPSRSRRPPTALLVLALVLLVAVVALLLT